MVTALSEIDEQARKVTDRAEREREVRADSETPMDAMLRKLVAERDAARYELEGVKAELRAAVDALAALRAPKETV